MNPSESSESYSPWVFLGRPVQSLIIIEILIIKIKLYQNQIRLTKNKRNQQLKTYAKDTFLPRFETLKEYRLNVNFQLTVNIALK